MWGPAHRSESEWIGLGRAMRTSGRQRRHCMGLFEPDIGVELFGENRFEIVAQVFGIGPVHNTDGALEQRLAQSGRQFSMGLSAPIRERSVEASLAEGVFIGVA